MRSRCTRATCSRIELRLAPSGFGTVFRHETYAEHCFFSKTRTQPLDETRHPAGGVRRGILRERNTEPDVKVSGNTGPERRRSSVTGSGNT